MGVQLRDHDQNETTWRLKRSAQRLSCYSMHYATCAESEGLRTACRDGRFPGIGEHDSILDIPRPRLLGIMSWYITGQTPPPTKGRRREGASETADWTADYEERAKSAELLCRPVCQPLRPLVALVLGAAARKDPAGPVQAQGLASPSRRRSAQGGSTVEQHMGAVAQWVGRVAGEMMQSREDAASLGSTAAPDRETRVRALHSHEPCYNAFLEQNSIPPPYPVAREEGRTWRRCGACRFKLTEELEPSVIPDSVLQQLQGEPPAAATRGGARGTPRPAYALCRVVREVLNVQAATPALMTAETAAALVDIGHRDPARILSLSWSFAPRLLAMLKPWGAATTAAGDEASPLLTELALRLAQCRLLTEQSLALELAEDGTETRTLPSSYLPAATGTVSHIDALDAEGRPILDEESGLPVRRQYVHVVPPQPGGDQPATPKPLQEVRTVPNKLYDLMKEAGIPHRVHLEKDDDGGGRGVATTCDHADRGRKPRSKASAGVCTFICPHSCVLGSVIMREHESQRDIWSWITNHCQRPPELIIYDNGCHLGEWVRSRQPGAARRCQFMYVQGAPSLPPLHVPHPHLRSA